MALTYQQVMAYSRTQAGQDAQNRIADCFPDDPNLGLSDAQIAAAMAGLGYPPGSRSPAFAVAWYLANGQNVWPQCGGVVQDPSAGGAATGPLGGGGPILPGVVRPPAAADAGISSDTLILIGGGLLLLLLIKRWSDS